MRWGGRGADGRDASQLPRGVREHGGADVERGRSHPSGLLPLSDEPSTSFGASAEWGQEEQRSPNRKTQEGTFYGLLLANPWTSVT